MTMSALTLPESRNLELIADAEHRAHIPLTDYGNAQRLVQTFGRDLRYTPGWGWLAWDGSRWQRDQQGHIQHMAKRTARGIREEARAASDTHREHLVRWQRQSESSARIAAMVELARSEPEVAVTVHAFDPDPWLLTVANGTIDLRDGTLRGHRREDLITQMSPVTYVPDGRCAVWERFLRDLSGDAALERFLQRAVGYTLTGSTSEEVFFFAHGPAATGKSTFMEAIKGVFGDYAATANFETFLKKRSDAGARPDLARLAGPRLAIASEVADGRAFDVQVVKAITGGDTITARYLYKDEFEFKPQFKLWFAANSRPAVDPGDTGMWRRVLAIPFTAHVPKERRDPSLKLRLTSHPGTQSAILRWAVEGCLWWQRTGLAPPEIITGSIRAYRAENDPVTAWLDACCTLEPHAWTAARSLTDSYEQWSEANHRPSLSDRDWGRALRALGLERDRKTGVRGWAGIRLTEQDQ
jgi:putative DNA primase/helicase